MNFTNMINSQEIILQKTSKYIFKLIKFLITNLFLLKLLKKVFD